MDEEEIATPSYRLTASDHQGGGDGMPSWPEGSGGGSGNGGRYFLSVAVTGLVTILGTVFVLWMTVGSHYVNRVEVHDMIEEASSRDRGVMAGTLATVVKATEMATTDIRSLLREIEAVKIEQGRTSVKLDEIRARLK